MDGSVAFATDDEILNEIERRVAVAGQGVAGIVIDFAGVNFIDSQGSEQIGKVVTFARREGVSLRFARVRNRVLEVLLLDGVVEELGSDRLHGNLDQAVEAELTS